LNPRTLKTALTGLSLAATLVLPAPASQAAEAQAASEASRATVEPVEQAASTPSGFERLTSAATTVAVSAASAATTTAVSAVSAAAVVSTAVTHAANVVTTTAATLFQTGRVSFYADKFHGRPTASGAIYDADEMTMAHRTLPLGTKVMITNTANQRSVVVTVNDRGPFTGGRVADLSRAAAEKINMIRSGIVDATLHILPTTPSKPDGKGSGKTR
jgi:rare lipoprotein A